jgi:chromosome segregation ATPase
MYLFPSQVSQVHKLKKQMGEMEEKVKSLNLENSALSRKVEAAAVAEASWIEAKTMVDEESNILQKAKLNLEGKVLGMEERLSSMVREKAGILDEKCKIEEELKSLSMKIDALSLELASEKSDSMAKSFLMSDELKNVKLSLESTREEKERILHDLEKEKDAVLSFKLGIEDLNSLVSQMQTEITVLAEENKEQMQGTGVHGRRSF